MGTERDCYRVGKIGEVVHYIHISKAICGTPKSHCARIVYHCVASADRLIGYSIGEDYGDRFDSCICVPVEAGDD
jgi:hypothetical protein